MKKKMIAGRCCKRSKKGVFRKKSREELQMERYARTMAYIADEDDYATRLMIASTKKLIKEREEAMMMAGGNTKERDEAMMTAASI